MATYPGMNKNLVELLRMTDEPLYRYTADRIEELEAEVDRLTGEITSLKERLRLELELGEEE